VRVEKGGSSDGVEWEMVADSTLIHGLIFADACCFGYNVMLMTILPLTVMEIYSRFTAWNWFHEAVRPSIHVLLRWLLYVTSHGTYAMTAILVSLQSCNHFPFSLRIGSPFCSVSSSILHPSLHTSLKFDFIRARRLGGARGPCGGRYMHGDFGTRPVFFSYGFVA